MPRMVRIRNVPDALHRQLKVRAAASGQTLSDYLLGEMEALGEGGLRLLRGEPLTKLGECEAN